MRIAFKTKADPYMIIKNIGQNRTLADGFVHQIVIWMSEKCNFT